MQDPFLKTKTATIKQPDRAKGRTKERIQK
jgi:hypothetical protein